MELNLFSETSGRLEPLSYSSDKDQLDVIEEILEAFESHDLVFLKGVVGSGKSVVGIRTALELGRGVVSVPTKVLARQYRNDYQGDKYFLKDGEKAKISVLEGRSNFTCPFLEKKAEDVVSERRELERKAEDEGLSLTEKLRLEDLGSEAGGSLLSAANSALPCTLPLRRGESRMDFLEDDPYWGFVFPAGKHAEKDELLGSYEGVKGVWDVFSQGECGYWHQYEAYLTADVIVMNSAKWEIEARIGRLPSVELTVVDEADHWLDGLCVSTSISERSVKYWSQVLQEQGDSDGAEALAGLWEDYWEGNMDPMELADGVLELLGEVEGSSFVWRLERVFEFEDEVVVAERESSVRFFVPDPEPVLRRMRERVGGKWLMMSATVQQREVLNRIYGIDPVMVEGEVEFPGRLVPKWTGEEVLVNHENWQRRGFREKYYDVRDQVFSRAGTPGFVPVHATKYLPLGLQDLPEEDERRVDGLLFSTKMNRGADLQGMESVVLLKFPFPDLSDPLLKAVKKRLGDSKFWTYYRDMARRKFIQQIGRTLRKEGDEVEFWSPDARCHQFVRRMWRGTVESPSQWR